MVKLKHISTTISYELSSTVVEWARAKRCETDTRNNYKYLVFHWTAQSPIKN